MTLYIYNGPVVLLGRVVEDNWRGATQAPNERRARSNLAYQWKRRNGFEPTSASPVFPGKLEVSV